MMSDQEFDSNPQQPAHSRAGTGAYIGNAAYIETVIARGDNFIDPQNGAVVPPIHLSTTYARDENYQRIGTIAGGYGRDDNPSFLLPEKMITALENGYATRLFSSGMAAISTLFQAFAPGDHVIVSRDMYFGTPKWLREWAQPWGLEISFVDTTDLDAVRREIRPGKSKMLYIETPANPSWAISDIAGCAELARAHHMVLAVDNTAATPVLTKPLDLGADFVVHSASKYLNGHSDVVAGAITSSYDSELWQKICKARFLAGAILGPFEAWLLQRGLRTLFVRVRHICQSAQQIADHFHTHPKVKQVCYPGLITAQGYAVAKKQMQGGFGGMLSLRLEGGAEAALSFTKKAQQFARATSMGGVESLIEHRYTIEAPDTITPPDLVRLSIGLEDVRDLIADLEQALL